MNKARSPKGYVDLDEDDAIRDTKRIFEKRGIDQSRGEAEVTRLLKISKDFFAGVAVVVPDVVEPVPDNVKVDIDKDSDDEDVYEFIISLAARGKKATLHRRAGCWRSRKLAFGSFELLAGPNMPQEGLYDARCKDCWRHKETPVTAASEASEGSEGGGGSASSATSATVVSGRGGAD